MAKIHPNAAASESSPSSSERSQKPPESRVGGGRAAVLTVWRKSLLFNFSGFTVFDDKGNLLFRVDNYVSGNKAEIVLMDAAGKPLLTIRRKKLSLGDRWLIYEGEQSANPKFSVKKHVSLWQSQALAQLTPCTVAGAGDGRGSYEVEGSYSRRCCAIYDESRRKLAEIKRKEAAAGGAGFGGDVFRLVVQPGLDAAVAMAIVILLEQMFH